MPFNEAGAHTLPRDFEADATNSVPFGPDKFMEMFDDVSACLTIVRQAGLSTSSTTEVQALITTAIDALKAGVSTSFDTLAEAAAKFGSIDTLIAALQAADATIAANLATETARATAAEAEIAADVAVLRSDVDAFEAMASQSGGLFASRAELYADLNWGANAQAWVLGDATAAYNGLYKKAGAAGTGSWSRVGDLPYTVIPVSSIGGTANAITGTTTLPLPVTDRGAIVVFEPTAANTGAVTIALNGAAAINVVTATGAALPAGSLISGRAVAGVLTGGTLRLVSLLDFDVAAAASTGQQIIGKTPVGTAPSVWNTVYMVFPTAATISGYITRVEISVAVAQQIVIGVYTLNGDGTLTRTAVSSEMYLTAGVNVITGLRLPIAAGQYWGHRVSTGAHYTNGSGAAIWYSGTEITTNTAKIVTGAVTLESHAVIEGTIRALANDLDANVGDKIDAQTIGKSSVSSSGTLWVSVNVIYQEPAAAAGYVTDVEVYVAAAQIVEVLICSRSGTAFTKLRSEQHYVSAAGVAALRCALPIAAGEYVAVRAIHTYTAAGTEAIWYAVAEITTATATTAHTLGPQMKVTVQGSLLGAARVAEKRIDRQMGGAWQGKAWAALGTSITSQGNYTKFLAARLGLTLTNAGVSGGSLGVSSTGHSGSLAITNAIATLPTDAKLVTVEAGTNDFGDGFVPLGTLGDTTTATFYGALYNAVVAITARCPDAVVVFLTPYSAGSAFAAYNHLKVRSDSATLRQFQDAVVQVARWTGCHVVDVGRHAGINYWTATRYTSDGLHLTTAGGARYAEYIAKYLADVEPMA